MVNECFTRSRVLAHGKRDERRIKRSTLARSTRLTSNDASRSVL